MAFAYKEARVMTKETILTVLKKADVYTGFKNPRPNYFEARDLKKKLRRRL
jgi:hypothetical protein